MVDENKKAKIFNFVITTSTLLLIFKEKKVTMKI